MKKMTMAAALLVALACLPSVSRAGTRGAHPATVGETAAERYAAPAPVDPSRREAADYAAREAAAPALAQFAGGGAGIYIGGSTLGVVLLVVILVILI